MNNSRNDCTDIPVIALQDGDMRVSLLGYGAITQGWCYKGQPLILGYDDPTEYLDDPFYLGAIVGRVANRIGGAGFDLDGTHHALIANEGANTLHGGPEGLSRQFWQVEQLSPCEAVLVHVSPHGAGGFPGAVRFEVRVRLDFPCLTYSISAWPDRPAPISIAQHNYYTLGSALGISEHRLQLVSDRHLELDDQGIPSGGIVDSASVGLDFAAPQPIGQVATDLDHFFLFGTGGMVAQPVATLAAPSGLTMTVHSDQPGAQVYSAAHLSAQFAPRAGLCIEPSGYPNAPNVPWFPSIIYTPEKPYYQTLMLEISEALA
ncbi:aldose epimerase family protein [Ruegeria arenilitoris]|uniref:aldose epimerase family protein n=1 Tax=Ruegeria arenilitoris TaxID=1173585 RepID=UPI00147DBE00|nr:aldose epimerase family protein [Ruegeria arenilitoris]